MSVTVLKPGLLTTLQSRPRNGMRHMGVPAGGAADPLSIALANRLVGNAWDATAIEATMLGPVLRFDVDCAIAIAGAPCTATLNGAAIAAHKTLVVNAGDELACGSATSGTRFYVAVSGGFHADKVLGSTATELQASFGGHHGRALGRGDEIRFDAADAGHLETPEEFRPAFTSSWALRATASLESAWLRRADAVFDANWTVGMRADRMGLRLEGARLEVLSDGRMPSAGVFPGTVQCPEDGTPYLLSVDAGTVGGYPRVAQVAQLDRHLLGQLRPGDHVRLLRRDPDDAVDELRAKLDYWRVWLPDIAEII